MRKISDSEKWRLLAETDQTLAANAISQEDSKKAAKIADDLGVSYMAEVVEHLDSDSASDMLRKLPQDFRLKVIELLPKDRAAFIHELLSYPENTAGALMSKEYLAIPDYYTVKQATHYIQSLADKKKGKISYIYVVNHEGILQGVIQIRDLLFHHPGTPVKNILVSPIISAHVSMSQTEVTKLFQQHRYLGFPVVDAAGRLMGVIGADSAIQAIEDAARSDIAKVIGTSAEEVKTKSILKILKLRIPWLLVSIVSGLSCAIVLDIFQQNASTLIILFLFIPVVLGVSESTGVQGATIVVQNIALGNVSFKDFGSLFLREIFVGVLIGAVCGGIVGIFASFWQINPILGAALLCSMTLAIIISALIGSVLPVIFRVFKVDPAMASGPLVLAICDIQTLIVYFSVSSLFLKP